MFLIVGLGNIGSEFEKTRHNVGFILLDKLFPGADFRNQDKFPTRGRSAFGGKAEIAETELNGQKVILVKPTTLMNDSGKAVKALVDFYKLDPAKDLLVIQDEIEMDLGEVELVEGCSAKGHNGIRSIIQELGTDQFKRIKIGVGKNLKPEQEVSDYVLENFSDGEFSKIINAADVVRKMISENIK